MILIGQYDSPFVRRCAIAMTLYGMVFEHRPWSTFGDGDQLAHVNPLRRVPTLVLDDGSVIIESAYILDYIDQQKGEGAFIARSGAARQKSLYVIALSTGFADKAVALFYERALHDVTSQVWSERLKLQICAVLDRLETLRAQAETTWIFGDHLNHADIALGCALRFARDVHGPAFAWELWPALAAHSARCEALPVFEHVSQVFAGPRSS